MFPILCFKISADRRLIIIIVIKDVTALLEYFDLEWILKASCSRESLQFSLCVCAMQSRLRHVKSTVTRSDFEKNKQ